MCFSSQAPVVGSRLGLGEDEELDGRAQVFVSFFFVCFFFCSTLTHSTGWARATLQVFK